MEHFYDGLKDLSVFLITSICLYAGHSISRFNSMTVEVKNSIVELNKNIAVILERLENHGQLLDRHENRIESLEDKI